MAATNLRPISEAEGWIAVRGGMLRKNVCHMPVVHVRWGGHRLRLARLLQRDTNLAQLLTGRPACERPMTKMKVWKHLRKAIDAGGMVSSAESAADDDAGFAEDLGVEEEEEDLQPAKKKPRATRIRGLEFVKVEVVRTPGSDAASTRAIIFENKTELSMDVGKALENLEWLLAAVQLERRDPDAVSVVHATSQPSSSSTSSPSRSVTTTAQESQSSTLTDLESEDADEAL